MFIYIFAVTFIALGLYWLLSHYFHLFDSPNESRKIHKQAKPTSAGIVFLLPVIVFLFLIVNYNLLNFNILGGLKLFQELLFPLSLFLLVSVGFIDDFKGLSVKIRLIILTLVSLLLLISYFGNSEHSYLLLSFYLISMLWWINLFNFMDGADGMAALHSIIALTFYYILFSGSNIQPLILIVLIVVSTFLLFNFPKAKMFMGDSGSLGLSFIIAVFAFKGIREERFGELLVFSIHLVFIIDATLTFLMRIIKGHKLVIAHNLHCYQSLVFHDNPHYKVSLLYALATFITSCLGYWLFQQQFSWTTQVAVILFESVILSFIWFKFTDLSRFELK